MRWLKEKLTGNVTEIAARRELQEEVRLKYRIAQAGSAQTSGLAAYPHSLRL